MADNLMTSSKIGAEDLDQELISMIENAGSKVESYRELITAETDSQTDFTMQIVTFDNTTDTIMVQRGRLNLFPDEDFTVSGSTIKLVEGVDAGTTIGITVLKNISANPDMPDDETTFSGTLIEPGSIPLDRLQEIPGGSEPTVTSDVPMKLIVTENGGLRIAYDDGSES